MDDTVEFISNGDAGVHWKNRMGTYIKTSQLAQGYPVFEQAKKEEDGKQYFLFVGPLGHWRVGQDITTYRRSVLQHPQTKPTPNLPPSTHWQYYFDSEWNQDNSLEAIVKVKGLKLVGNGGNAKIDHLCITESSQKQKDLPRLPYSIITLQHGRPVYEIIMSNNNQYVYTGGDGGYVRIWDINQLPTSISPCSREYGTPICQLKLGSSDYDRTLVLSLKLMPHGSCLIVGGLKLMGKSIHVIDLAGPCPTFKSQLGSSTKDCSRLAISPDGRLCYSCHMNDSNVQVWDIHNEIVVRELQGHTSSVTCIDMSSDGTKLWTGGEDEVVRIWDPRASTQLRQLELESEPVDLACCPTDDLVAVLMEYNVVEVLHGTKPEKHKVELGGGCARSVKFANSGKWFVTSGEGIFGCTSPSGPKIFTLEASSVRCAISSDDSYMVLGSDQHGETAEVYRVPY